MSPPPNLTKSQALDKTNRPPLNFLSTTFRKSLGGEKLKFHPVYCAVHLSGNLELNPLKPPGRRLCPLEDLARGDLLRASTTYLRTRLTASLASPSPSPPSTSLATPRLTRAFLRDIRREVAVALGEENNMKSAGTVLHPQGDINSTFSSFWGKRQTGPRQSARLTPGGRE